MFRLPPRGRHWRACPGNPSPSHECFLIRWIAGSSPAMDEWLGRRNSMASSRAHGVDIWYETAGAGPALVLLHANPFDHDLWLYQTAHFSTWFKVIGIDLRGYGRSAKVTTPYTLKDMGNDVVGVLNDLGVTRAI